MTALSGEGLGGMRQHRRAPPYLHEEARLLLSPDGSIILKTKRSPKEMTGII